MQSLKEKKSFLIVKSMAFHLWCITLLRDNHFLSRRETQLLFEKKECHNSRPISTSTRIVLLWFLHIWKLTYQHLWKKIPILYTNRLLAWSTGWPNMVTQTHVKTKICNCVRGLQNTAFSSFDNSVTWKLWGWVGSETDLYTCDWWYFKLVSLKGQPTLRQRQNTFRTILILIFVSTSLKVHRKIIVLGW